MIILWHLEDEHRSELTSSLYEATRFCFSPSSMLSALHIGSGRYHETFLPLYNTHKSSLSPVTVKTVAAASGAVRLSLKHGHRLRPHGQLNRPSCRSSMDGTGHTRPNQSSLVYVRSHALTTTSLMNKHSHLIQAPNTTASTHLLFPNSAREICCSSLGLWERETSPSA